MNLLQRTIARFAFTPREIKKMQDLGFDGQVGWMIDLDQIVVNENKAELEEIYSDDEIKGSHKKIVRALSGKGYTLSGNGADTLQPVLDNLLSDYIENCTRAVFFGDTLQKCAIKYGAAEKMLLVESPNITHKDGVAYVEVLQSGKKENVTLDGLPSLFYHIYGETTKHKHGRGILHDLKNLYCMKKLNRDNFDMWQKRYAQGFIIGNIENADASEQVEGGVFKKRGNIFLDSLQKLMRGSAIVMGDGQKAEIWQPDGAAAKTFFEQEDRINKAIQRVILGESKTGGIDQGGAYAQAVVAKEVLDETVQSYAEFTESYVQQLVNFLSELYNVATPPLFKFNNQTQATKEKADIIKTLNDAGWSVTQQGLKDIMGYDYTQFTQETQTTDARFALGGTVQNISPEKIVATVLSRGESRFSDGQQEIERIKDKATAVSLPDLTDEINTADSMETMAKALLTKRIHLTNLAEEMARAYKAGYKQAEDGVV